MVLKWLTTKGQSYILRSTNIDIVLYMHSNFNTTAGVGVVVHVELFIIFALGLSAHFNTLS